MAPIPKSNRATHYVIWGTALILVILAIYAVRSLTTERVDVRVAKVTYQNLVKSFPTTGKVDLLDDFQFHAQAPGEIEQIYVKPLQHVSKGQLLLRLDDTAALSTLAHAQADLRAAELAASNMTQGGSREERTTSANDLNRANLQLQQDQANYSTTQKLQQQGAASPAEVSAAQHRVQMDESAIQGLKSRTTQRYSAADEANAQAQVADARAAVAAAQSALADVIVKSQIDGTVYYLPVTPHEYVQTNDELIDVANLTKKRVIAYFDEPDIGALAVGQPVKITWEAKPGMEWFGRISQTPTTIIPYLTRFVGEATVTVDDPTGVLDPNANVLVTVTTAQHFHVLCVPREALKHDSAGDYVFRIVNNRLVRTPVKTGIINLAQVEITSGLSEGETVALNPTDNRDLTNGLEVTPVQ